jgi:SAM-dependent methyltransferase
LKASELDKSFLVKLFGFPATLIHGDTLVLDRWRWLRQRLPKTRNGETLIDIGCGTGAFTIGAALRGYRALGLSWDERNQTVAAERSRLCRAPGARFEIQDARRLDQRTDLHGQFDFVINCENIEHILDDGKLMRDIAACLKPGGRLLLTTPYFHYRPMVSVDEGPFSTEEDGGHVRRGYTKAMLEELCEQAGLRVDEVSYCSGTLSQLVSGALRKLSLRSHLGAWALTFPMRPLPPLLDWLLTPLLRWPFFSICIEAYKPRFAAGMQRPQQVADFAVGPIAEPVGSSDSANCPPPAAPLLQVPLKAL